MPVNPNESPIGYTAVEYQFHDHKTTCEQCDMHDAVKDVCKLRGKVSCGAFDRKDATNVIFKKVW